MCFFSKTKKLKRAIRPIRVYKWLNSRNQSPFYDYEYQKGLNVAKGKILEIEKYPYYSFGQGMLHAFKDDDHFDIIKMYIPIGAKYNDNGAMVVGDVDCRDQIISTKLYWPKNKFEKWWYNLISKKY